jgi:3-hydroxy-3-methylglutaryl CoA synthase
VTRRVGIERIGVHPCSLSLSLPELCLARGRRPDDICKPMMLAERSLNPLWEDPVTMAVNAANGILTADDRARIELLVVASESGVDHEKPISTWVQRYAGLGANCRNFEIKHACYGGTAGLQLAASWLASSAPAGAKALVVATDQSRPHFGKPWEFVLGAGAAAVLLSAEPSLAEIEIGRCGYWTTEISDLTRPTSSVETGNSETSLVSYLDALEGAYEHFVARVPEAAGFDDYFRWHVYHMPFGGMAWRAHKAILRTSAEVTTGDAWASFERKGLSATRYARRMGATYSSSTFIGLLGLIDGSDVTDGDRVSVFSYGSGCCAEFYCARIGPEAKAAARVADLPCRLVARRQVSVDEYEGIERQRTAWVDAGDYEVRRDGLGDWYDRAYRDRGLLVFTGMSDFYRQYAWS